MPFLRPPVLLLPLLLPMLLTFSLVAMTTVGALDEEVWSVTGVAGRTSDLPCYLNPRTPNDRPKLILWYKRGTRTPVFSYDGRTPPLEPNNRQEGGRVTVSRDAATLTLSSVGLDAEGVYECRVDFFKSPTHNSLVNLTIVEPPRSVEVSDSQRGPAKEGIVGPYHEGEKVILICVSRRGTPQPNVTWWHGDRLLDDTWESGGDDGGGGGGGGEVQNILVVERLTRDYHNTTLTCAATNTRLVGPVTTRVVVKMLLLPTSVVVRSEGAVREESQAVLGCVSRGSRPAARLSWKLNGDPLPKKLQRDGTDFLDGGDVSSSTLVLNVTRKHDGAQVTCEAKNPTRPGAPLTNTTTLTVHYAPRVKATLGKSVKPALLKEGDDVYFTCSVSANPPAEPITWFHEGERLVHNSTAGIILVGESLALQKVGRRQAGKYTCAAANQLSAVTSHPIILRIKYTPECRTSPTTYFIYDKPINITCTVASYPPVKSILWQWNNSNEILESQPVPEPENKASAQLTVYPVQNPEDRALSCWAVNEMGKQTQPCGFSVKVAKAPLPLSSCRLANITASSLSLTCQRPDVAAAGTTLYRAEVYFENRTLFANVTSHRPNFNVSRLDAGTSYQIKVYVTHGPVTSQPVVVSAYTSRSSRSTSGDKDGGDSGTSVGGALGGVAVTVAILAAAVAARNYCRKRRGRRKQDPRPPSEDSNPDVVPNIASEETYDLLSSAERKVDATLYEVVDGPMVEDAPMSGGKESYHPLVLQQQSPREMMEDYPGGARSGIYCPVDQLMQAEESVV